RDRGVMGEGTPAARAPGRRLFEPRQVSDTRRGGGGHVLLMELLAVAVAGRGRVEPREPVFAADDEALLRGRSVFETTRVYGGRPFLLDRHLPRFAVSARRARRPPP